MEVIKGDIGAIGGFTAVVVFSPQAHGSIEDARSPLHGEGSHLLDEPVHLRPPASYTPLDQILL
jgi:hypothetical protein